MKLVPMGLNIDGNKKRKKNYLEPMQNGIDF